MLNGLRRYWPSAGPQEAQYIPGPLLRAGENELILLEVEASPAEPTGPPCSWVFLQGSELGRLGMEGKQALSGLQ